MSVIVVGLEHRTAPLDVLERVTVPEEDTAKVLGDLRDLTNLSESVLLSTCLRTEVYAVVERFHDAVAELEGVLAGLAGTSPADLEPQFTVRFDDDVAVHLFSVAAGLESAVPGEGEVLGQVRRAWHRAQAAGVSGPVLSGLFRHAVETGKRVRSETAIARGTTSFSHAAVALAHTLVARGLGGTDVVVVGAGQMGAGLVGALVSGRPDQRPARVTVANRTVERAAEVVRAVQGPAGGASPGPAGSPVDLRATGLRALADAVASADVVLAAVHGQGPVLTPGHLAGRREPLVVVDLGVPRNVDPAVAAPAPDEAAVTLRNLDDLRVAVDQALEGRREEMEAARAIVDDEVARYRAASRARVAAPVIAALRQRLEELRVAELERRAGDLGDDERARVDEVSRAALAKLLHEPTLLLKETAGTPRGERLVEALRILFDL